MRPKGYFLLGLGLLLFLTTFDVLLGASLYNSNVEINSNATYTNSRNVKVKLFYDGFSDLNIAWWYRAGETTGNADSDSTHSLPMLYPYPTNSSYEFNWTLSAGDGDKTIYIRFGRTNKWGTTYDPVAGGYYYDTITLDTTAPTAGNIEIKNADQNGYDVYVYNVNDQYSGVQIVKFPTWTSFNGQDDLIWHNGTNMGNGTWMYHVNRSEHKNEAGQYYTHIYTYDNIGNSAYVGEVIPIVPNQASNLSITAVTNSSITAAWNSNGNISGTIYNLVLQRPSDQAWLSNPETTGTTYTFNGLSSNTQYNVWVRVRNASVWATSGYQLIGQLYTYANVPTSLSWGTAGQTSLTLNWGKNGNPSNVQYRVVLTDPATGVWLYNSDFQTDINTWTFNGLTAGKQYRGWVQARNTDGVETSWVNFGTKWTLPASPTGINGTNGGLAWSNTSGRGYVTLSWPAVTGATGYRIHVFDGYSYRAFDVGSATSWDSRTAKIYPAESTLDAYGDDTVTADLFNHSNTGLDLRDNPNKLYQKTAYPGYDYDSAINYWFRVTAYNTSGDSGIDWNHGYFPTLPSRTDLAAPTVIFGTNGNSTPLKSQSTLVTVTDAASGVSSGYPKYQWTLSSTFPTTGTWTSFVSGSAVASSTGNGDNYLHIHAVDTAGNETKMTSSKFLLDNIPPTGIVTINSGAQTTYSQAVRLYIVGDDGTGSGVTDITVSENQASTVWEPYNSLYKDFTLSAGEGDKTVYVKFKDAAGNEGTAVSTKIKYTAPIYFFDSVQHNQVIKVGTKDVVVTAPSVLASGETLPAGQSIDSWNKFIDGDYVKYRLILDINDTNKVKQIQDIKLEFHLNDTTEDGVALNMDTIQLKKNNTVIKDLKANLISSNSIRLNRYSARLGKDTDGQSIFPKHGTGQYTIEYTARLGVRNNYTDKILDVSNDVILKVYTGAGSLSDITEPDRASHKTSITTKVLRKSVIAQ